MKSLVLATAVLFTATLYSQNYAFANTTNGNDVIQYNLNEVVVSNTGGEILLGELNEKSKKGRPITADSKVAYYFENSTGEKGLYLNTMLFKVQKVKFRTEARICLYTKHDFVQDTYHPETGVKDSYNSFVPGEKIEKQDIVVYIEPGQNRILEVDLSKYSIVMPADGIFVSLEGVGYYDENGKSIEELKPKERTWIDFHPTNTENYCDWINPLGTGNWFWVNINKILKYDYKNVLKATPPKNTFKAPNFGLKVNRR